MIAALLPGQTLTIQGLHVVETLVAVSGAADEPITIRGDGGVIEHPDGRTATGGKYALLITGSYLHFVDLTVGEAGKGIVVDGASHVRFDRCVGQNTSTEVWKIRGDSAYIYLYDCRVEGGGIGGGGFGEGFYVGDAATNWPTPSVVPDVTNSVTFVRCYATRCKADGWDIKEGAHHVILKDCLVDHTRGNAPAQGASLGDSGIYCRADDVQFINTNVRGAPGYGLKLYDTPINSVTYGRRNEVWGGISEGHGLAGVGSQQDDLKVYANFRASGERVDVVGGGWDADYDPATFVEMTWSSPAASYGVGLMPHAASHGVHGEDRITPASIGAAGSLETTSSGTAGSLTPAADDGSTVRTFTITGATGSSTIQPPTGTPAAPQVIRVRVYASGATQSVSISTSIRTSSGLTRGPHSVPNGQMFICALEHMGASANAWVLTAYTVTAT
jgi:hypothetical protein